ncbi:MAG: aminodeoxychorismate/anthranilate synthase component II [Chloroflexi bacterium]|nr:aminodeoxychorismate/anthranilate synthase component II [Chloroflexota bacterium]
MKALLVDAYDSFVYIIYQYLMVAGAEASVVRNDKISPKEIVSQRPDFIVLGPGPGHPADAGYVPMIKEASAAGIPIFGVCLGHQAIGLAFGGVVEQAKHLMHGKTSKISHDGEGCFTGLPEPLTGTRYHSLIVAEESVQHPLVVSAKACDDGYVMGMRHRTLPIESLQFHPESIHTENGMRIVLNFIEKYVR